MVSGVRAAWARIRDQLDWEAGDSGFPDTAIIPGTPDPASAIWASLSYQDQVRLSGLVTGGPQMRFDHGPGPYAGLVTAGLAANSTMEVRAYGHPAGFVHATPDGVRVLRASSVAHRVNLRVQV